MSASTIMLEWKALMEKIQSANAQDTHILWAELKEHEAYMTNKGYKIQLHQVTSPSGEILWKRSH